MKVETSQKQDMEISRRIANYACAIKAVGLKKLMNNLIDEGILKEGFNYDTFKSNYHRLQEMHTGLFLRPNVLSAIFKYLDSFTYKDLFEEAETSNSETKTYSLNKEQLSVISSLVEQNKKLLESNKNLQKEKTPRDYTHSNDFFESANLIYRAINNLIIQNELHHKALECIFNITFPQKKLWKYRVSPKLNRIDNLFNHLAIQPFGCLTHLEGKIIVDYSKISNSKIINIVVLGNYYFVLAYQILLIEQLYKLFSKNNCSIKYTHKELKEPENHIDIVTIFKIKIEKKYDNLHKNNFLRLINEFNSIFDFRLENHYGINLNGFEPAEDKVPSIEYLQGVYKIITFLNDILARFVYPKEMTNSNSFGGKPIPYLDYILNRQEIEKNCVVSLTDNDLTVFGEYNAFFKNLEYKKIELQPKPQVPQPQSQPQFPQNANKVDIISQGNSVYPHKSGQPIHRQTNNPNGTSYVRTIADDLLDDASDD